jgi:hypothetical protein
MVDPQTLQTAINAANNAHTALHDCNTKVLAGVSNRANASKMNKTKWTKT